MPDACACVSCLNHIHLVCDGLSSFFFKPVRKYKHTHHQQHGIFVFLSLFFLIYCISRWYLAILSRKIMSVPTLSRRRCRLRRWRWQWWNLRNLGMCVCMFVYAPALNTLQTRLVIFIKRVAVKRKHTIAHSSINMPSGVDEPFWRSWSHGRMYSHIHFHMLVNGLSGNHLSENFAVLWTYHHT